MSSLYVLLAFPYDMWKFDQVGIRGVFWTLQDAKQGAQDDEDELNEDDPSEMIAWKSNNRGGAISCNVESRTLHIREISGPESQTADNHDDRC
jgi:hypothetical protein